MPTPRITFMCAMFCLFSFQASSQFFDSLSRPALWLRPDRGMISTVQWEDVSGHTKHATFNAPLAALSTSSLNFHKIILLNGTDNFLTSPVSLENLSELSVLTVFQTADTVERIVWRTANATNRKIKLTTRRSAGPDSLTDYYGKHEQVAYLNTIAQSWDKATPSASIATFEIGNVTNATNDRFFKGGVAEVLVFKRALSFLERAQLETYLAIKYGVGAQGHNYVSSSEKALWNTERNASYKRIAGIGRDDAFELLQLQSQSAYDSGMITMSVGALASTNAQNSSSIEDGNFILWGDNEKSLSLATGTGVDSVLAVTQRKWLVAATTTTVQPLTVDVYVDLSRLPFHEGGYWLVIDRSGRGNFSVDNLEYILVDRISNGKAIYKVQWDSDRSGTDNFALARTKDLFAIARTLQHPLCTNETAGKVSIEVIGGNAPFQYSLTSVANELERSGRIAARAEEEEGLSAGDYVLTLRDGNRDEVVRNFSLRMPDALYIDAGTDRSLTENTDIILDAGTSVPDSVAVTYLWQNNFGFRAEQQKITVSESGIYRVTVTKESDGCAFSDEVVVSGTEEQRIAVYPTLVRANSSFIIGVSLPESGNVQISIVNPQGMSVQLLTGQDQLEYQFNTTLSASGTYVVVIQTPNGTESRKVIVL